MSLRLLIDECLSPELARVAIAAGHAESTCVRNRGWSGLKDHELMRHVCAEDFVLVTHNARDFRGDGAGSTKGLHAKVEIHAGLVCLNSAFTMDLLRQHDLFGLALDELERNEDLVNTALEVFESEDGEVRVIRYGIPP